MPLCRLDTQETHFYMTVVDSNVFAVLHCDPGGPFFQEANVILVIGKRDTPWSTGVSTDLLYKIGCRPRGNHDGTSPRSIPMLTILNCSKWEYTYRTKKTSHVMGRSGSTTAQLVCIKWHVPDIAREEFTVIVFKDFTSLLRLWLSVTVISTMDLCPKLLEREQIQQIVERRQI